MTTNLPPSVKMWPGDGWPLAAVHPDLAPIPIPVAERLAAPRTFHVTIEHSDDEWILTLMFSIEDGSVLFSSAWASGTELHTALAAAARIQPLRWWQERAFAHVMAEQQESDRDRYLEAVREELDRAGSEDIDGDAAALARDYFGGAGQPPVVGVRRNRITSALLESVAETYREAVRAERPDPTRAVAEKFGKKHSTAANWVVRARKEGHLGPADGTRGGEKR